MPRFTDHTGKVFGRLTVLHRAPNKRQGATRWACRCSCGAALIVLAWKLVSGFTRSCGCLKKDMDGKHTIKHGMVRTRAYKAWRNMLNRCYYKSAKGYENYGRRGITVCKRWRSSFESFLSDMGHPPPGKSLERKNNDGNYTPKNCTWATRSEQNRNQRRRKSKVVAEILGENKKEKAA